MFPFEDCSTMPPSESVSIEMKRKPGASGGSQA